MYKVRNTVTNKYLNRNGKAIFSSDGDVRTALERSLNYAIKGSDTELSLAMIQKTIDNLDSNIKKAFNDNTNS